jgi:quercetin dioxygenase-like cupin family protein
MKVTRRSAVPEREVSFNAALFTGPATSQAMVDGKQAQFSVAYIHFPDGVRNKFHTHSNDQVLIVTEGRGMVATDEREEPLEVGDVAHIPAGEIHRHGARPGSSMTHVSILPAGTRTEQVEQ